MRLSGEALASFAEAELAGRVRLGLPDDYAERYLPEILARFSHSNPRVEVTVVCEPTPMLLERIENADLDLAIITQVNSRSSVSVIRRERPVVGHVEPPREPTSRAPCPLRSDEPSAPGGRPRRRPSMPEPNRIAFSIPVGTPPRSAQPCWRASRFRCCPKARCAPA